MKSERYVKSTCLEIGTKWLNQPTKSRQKAYRERDRETRTMHTMRYDVVWFDALYECYDKRLLGISIKATTILN